MTTHLTTPEAETLTNSWPVKLAKFFADLVYYLGWFAMVLLVGITIASLFGLKPTELTNQVPVEMTFDQTFKDSAEEYAARPYLVGMEGLASIRVQGEPVLLAAGQLLWGLMMLIGFMWAAYQLRKVMQSVKQGDPFNAANPGRIRIIGYVVLAWSPIEALWSHIAFRLHAVELEFPGATVDLSNSYHSDLVLLGLVVLVLAQVFAVGVRLHQEQALTI